MYGPFVSAEATEERVLLHIERSGRVTRRQSSPAQATVSFRPLAVI